jgi:hypothetical protein
VRRPASKEEQQGTAGLDNFMSFILTHINTAYQNIDELKY